MFDPITEFDKAEKWVEDFLASHRIEPYTPEEIEAMRSKTNDSSCTKTSEK